MILTFLHNNSLHRLVSDAQMTIDLLTDWFRTNMLSVSLTKTCYSFVTGRMPQSGKLPVLNKAKNQVFRPTGATRCTDSR